ncbi:MAG TPA: condensation domain-containing protein, partial [Thermoanaerobaculia bacterium]|nr:condensation domain-containing protein [Thermoanaerobaculia bacterium]
EALGVELSVRQVFELRTVAEVASWIERTQQRVHRDLPLVPIPRDRDLPLSFGQERLWFLEQLDPGSAAYNMPTILEIRGPLSPAALAGSLCAITRRHESLRTRFVAGPLQQVAPFTPWAPPCIDLSALPPETARREADLLGRQEAAAPFDLARGPLLRATLLRLSADEHRLILVFHHIVADGWSLALFFDELAGSSLPELPIQYPDFAVWQRESMKGAAIEEELAHWRAALDGAPPHLELPTDRPRPAVQAFRGSTWSGRLPAVATRNGVTPFMALLAALEVLLSRYSGQDDLVVGTTVAGRGRVETEKLIGFFVNTLALRGNLKGDPTVLELLGRVRDGALAAYAHQDLPFERLVAELQPERDLSRTPLFQVLLTLQNAGKTEIRLPGLDVRPLDVETGATKLDLSLSLTEDAEGLAARWTFDSSLFDHGTVARMAGSFAQLLREMVEAPGSRLSGLRMLTAAEREQLAAWNSTAAAVPPDLTLSRLVATQIARTPDAVALVFEGEALTYRELGEKAGALAGHLRRNGVGPEVLVGLFLERSIEMVVGMLGILAAGGAYVPLDPSHPRERLAAMIADASPKLVVTIGCWRDRLPEIPILLLDDLEAGPHADLAGEAGPEHLAYVIFTSGSTGRPKGVMNTHRGIVNRLLWAQRTLPLLESDRVVQKTPATFDVSVPEIFLPLITGARLVLARADGHRDPAYLAQLISEEGITSAHFVPSMLRLFLAEPDLPARLRRVFTSGEALPADLAEQCLASLDAEL